MVAHLGESACLPPVHLHPSFPREEQPEDAHDRLPGFQQQLRAEYLRMIYTEIASSIANISPASVY